jgi:hypothetical protein
MAALAGANAASPRSAGFHVRPPFGRRIKVSAIRLAAAALALVWVAMSIVVLRGEPHSVDRSRPTTYTEAPVTVPTTPPMSTDRVPTLPPQVRRLPHEAIAAAVDAGLQASENQPPAVDLRIAVTAEEYPALLDTLASWCVPIRSFGLVMMSDSPDTNDDAAFLIHNIVDLVSSREDAIARVVLHDLRRPTSRATAWNRLLEMEAALQWLLFVSPDLRCDCATMSEFVRSADEVMGGVAAAVGLESRPTGARFLVGYAAMALAHRAVLTVGAFDVNIPGPGQGLAAEYALRLRAQDRFVSFSADFVSSSTASPERGYWCFDGVRGCGASAPTVTPAATTVELPRSKKWGCGEYLYRKWGYDGRVSVAESAPFARPFNMTEDDIIAAQCASAPLGCFADTPMSGNDGHRQCVDGRRLGPVYEAGRTRHGVRDIGRSHYRCTDYCAFNYSDVAYYTRDTRVYDRLSTRACNDVAHCKT